MLKICTNGHITGIRHCTYCDAETPGRIVVPQPNFSTDKRIKRRMNHNLHQFLQKRPITK